jgi:hypothetical protein
MAGTGSAHGDEEAVLNMFRKLKGRDRVGELGG